MAYGLPVAFDGLSKQKTATGMPHRSITNPLMERDPCLFHRLSAFAAAVNGKLLDKLAGQMLADPSFRIRECPHALAEVKATALLLHVLTKETLDADDFRVLDSCWRQATASALFGEEFEGERQRIQQCIAAAKPQAAGKAMALF